MLVRSRPRGRRAIEQQALKLVIILFHLRAMADAGEGDYTFEGQECMWPSTASSSVTETPWPTTAGATLAPHSAQPVTLPGLPLEVLGFVEAAGSSALVQDTPAPFVAEVPAFDISTVFSDSDSDSGWGPAH